MYLCIMNLDSLPKKESRKAYLTKKHGDMWNLHHFDHSWHRSDKNDYVWVKVKRVIKKYMGKSFDEAFSYFCTLVPKHEQSEFLKEFEKEGIIRLTGKNIEITDFERLKIISKTR